MTIDQLNAINSFSRKDYYDAYKEKYGDKSIYALDYALRKATSEGSIIHIGRNRYTFRESRRFYTPHYSPEACKIAKRIKSEYPLVDFRIFELKQINSFVNHLFAHNTIFVSVENDVIDFVFDFLHNEYPGKVLLKPKVEDYYRYLVDNQIVIVRLPSESPKGINDKWHIRIEKILVDITADKLISQLVPQSEYDNIINEIFSLYIVDTSTLLRYANRKGAVKKIKNLLSMFIHFEEG